MEWAIGGLVALIGVLRLLSKLERRVEALKDNAETNNKMISRLQQQVRKLEEEKQEH